MVTAPTQPLEGYASPAPATGAPPPPPVPPTFVPAPSDPRLIDLLGKMLRIDPSKRPTAQEILEHDWITNPVAPEPEEEPSFTSCSAASDAEPQQFNNCGASDEEPQTMSCGATAPASAAYRSLGGTELVLPKLTRTHALVAIEEGWAFTGFPV